MAPLFSVFIPVRNDARWLPGAIGSVAAQTLDDWELVIGDNVSEDDARAVADGVADERVRYHRFADVVDVVANFNRTAQLCEGEWIVPLGADDRLEPAALETFARAIRERPELVMVVGRCARVDEEGAPAAAVWRFYQGLAPLEPGDYDARGWLRAISADGQPTWSLGSIAFRRSAVEALGGLFDPAAGGASDMELAMRMAIAGPVRYVDTPVMIYTQRTNSDQRQQQRTNRVDDSADTVMGRAFRVGLAAHEAARGPLDRRERRGVQGMIARSFVQRAAQHRVLEGGGGRGRRLARRATCPAGESTRRAEPTPARSLPPLRCSPRGGCSPSPTACSESGRPSRMTKANELRVLQVSARFLPQVGGVERHMYEVATRLPHHGVAVEVLTTDAIGDLEPEEVLSGIPIQRVPAYPRNRDLYLAPAIYRRIRHGDWDVVHVQGIHTFVPPLAMLAARRSDIPYVVTFHTGGHSSRLRSRLRRWQWTALRPPLRDAAQLIAVSHFERRLFQRDLGLSSSRFEVIPNGARIEIDRSAFDARPRRSEPDRLRWPGGALQGPLAAARGAPGAAEPPGRRPGFGSWVTAPIASRSCAAHRSWGSPTMSRSGRSRPPIGVS